jgi:CheY-like chemotaxis protein
MNILLADDSADIREIYQLAFRLKGHQLNTVSNGQEAVQLLEQAAEPFDAVVLDIEMPIMDGIEALKQIRLLPHGQKIPVMMFTAYLDAEYDQKTKDAGANLLVRKPIYPDELLRFLGWLVQGDKGRWTD